MEKMICRQGMADTSQAWIYYKESGRGTPILMLHGNAETHLIFDYYEKKLSMKYCVILMDSRAHGRSRIKPEYAESEFTTTDMARDAAALLDILHLTAETVHPQHTLLGFHLEGQHDELDDQSEQDQCHAVGTRQIIEQTDQPGKRYANVVANGGHSCFSSDILLNQGTGS